jgi:o-succinylbenzoate---CoA ligase
VQSAFPNGPRPPRPQSTIPSDWLRGRAEASPRALALRVGEACWTYGELDGLVDDLCGWLTAVGLPGNGRVAALLPNGLGYVCLIHALVRLGQTLVPLNTRLTAAEITWQLEQVGCGWLLTEDEGLAMEDWSLAPHHAPILGDKPLLLLRSPAPLPPCPPAPFPQAILFTSGTTGQPKAVALTLENHFYSALGSATKLGVQVDDVWLSCLPLYHVGGLAVIFRSCLYGTAVDLHPRFDLEVVNHALDHYATTLISVVPTMLYRLVQSRTGWPASLRLILVGGAAAEEGLVRAANELGRGAGEQGGRGAIVATTYGMTETASQMATLLPEEVAGKPGSVGRPLLFTRLRAVDEVGRPCAVGEIGEIWVQGPIVADGYVNNPLANSERFVEGWFRTGDMGYVDGDGDWWIVQRRTDLIVSGGENVYPAEVERVLRQHPAVADVCVVGVPDAEWGQVVAAAVQLHSHTTATAEELRQFAQPHLARYKLPRRIAFVPQLPLTASGKIARAEVLGGLGK